MWFEQFSACRENNGFEEVNLEKGVAILQQRGDDALNCDCENEVLCETAQPWNESTTFPVES